MGATGANFLQRFNEIVTGGDTFLREVELPHSAVRVAADGGLIVGATAPTKVAQGISFAGAETADLHFNIPMDYDEGVDICALRLHEVAATDDANTGLLGITTAQDIYRAGAAVDATVSDAVAEAAISNAGLLVRENVLDISGRGYKPGDHITLVLTCTATTELILLGTDLIYAGDLAAYNDDDRFRDIG